LDNTYFWADWYVGHNGLKIKSGKAFEHFRDIGFDKGLNPNPLISVWWLQQSIGIYSFDHLTHCIKDKIRSHPFFDVGLFPNTDNCWKYYANNAKEKSLDPCSEMSFIKLISLNGLQNKHFVTAILILGENYRNFLEKNSLKQNVNTRLSFISNF
jgi:hypothetical protein